jgi:iron complex outermembrane receptor protein
MMLMTPLGFAANGSAAYDAANLAQAGTRLDWSASDKDTLTVEGGGYRGGLQKEESAFPGPGLPKTALFNSARLRGGHFLSHWTHRFLPLSSTELLGYCDWADHISFATEARNTCQLEFQHNIQFEARHSLVWGGSAATSMGTTYQSFTVQGVPAQQRTATESIFGQYELTVIPDRLRLITGAKLEHNSYTGVEIQPQIRGMWSPKKAHTVWAAVSRAVRTPTRMEDQEQVKLTPTPHAGPHVSDGGGQSQPESGSVAGVRDWIPFRAGAGFLVGCGALLQPL